MGDVYFRLPIDIEYCNCDYSDIWRGKTKADRDDHLRSLFELYSSMALFGAPVYNDEHFMVIL